jgi:ABC-type multidrug transport system fused ATPase/permease subunit
MFRYCRVNDKKPLMPKIASNRRGRGIAMVALCALGQAICAGVAAFATRDVFHALREPVGFPTAALAAIGLAGIGIALMRVGERTIAEKVGQDYVAELRKALFNHLTRVPARIIQQKRNGSLALRFVGDLSAIRGWVSLGLARLISAAIVLPCAGIVLYLLHPALALAAMVPIGIGLVVMFVVGIKLEPLYRSLRSSRARIAADMSERIPVAAELRLLGRMDIEIGYLEKRTSKLIEAAVKRSFFTSILRAIPDIASGTAAAALLYIALTVGVAAPIVAGALSALGLMIHPMRSLAGVWDNHRAWIVAREKCERLLAIPRHAMVDRTPLTESDSGLSLTFLSVSSEKLRDIDAELKAGRKIAVIGKNGAGKSTLLHLAAGIDTPERGVVKIGDKTPASLSARERMKWIGLMSKASPILAGSLRRALTMGAPKRPDDSEIISVARTFGLGAVIERLGGLDGKVSEAGRNLSSGEVRRLLLTRLALGQSAFLLLDEPDDALDAQGADLVMQLLKRPGAGALVVTHDLALARRLDEIWVIDGGELILQGPPSVILASGSHWARQMGEDLAA